MPERKTISFTAGGYLQDPAAFHYSNPIAGSGTVGNEQTLDPFLVAPRKLFPGSMPVSLRSAQDRADVIA
jgi:cytochrome c2